MNKENLLDDSGNLQLNNLTPTDKAKEVWVNAYNRIETQLSKDGELPHIKPTAAKMAENMLRISGIFATLEDTAEITLEQMSRAIMLGRYYLKSFLWIVNKGDENKLLNNANELLEWIKKNYRDDKVLRNKFFEFMGTVFPSADFREWFDMGFWSDEFIQFSLLENGKIISNV